MKYIVNRIIVIYMYMIPKIKNSAFLMLCLMHYRCKRTILIYKDKKRMYIILQNTIKKHTRKSKLSMNI